MNHTDNLLKIDFLSLSHEEQMAIKQLGPHQPRQFKHHQRDITQKRSFSSLWFDKIEWLTVSLQTKRFFCFYCLLFGGSDTPWSKTGNKDLKRLSERTKKHEKSTVHINNAVRFKTLGASKKSGDAQAGSIYAHNEMVRKNRHVLDRIITCVRFCAGHQLDLHDDKGPSVVLPDLVEYVATLDHALHGHAQTGTASAKPTSKAIVDELLDCMYHVYQDDVRRAIKNAHFVSVQVHETTDVSNHVQLALTARFLTGTTIAERFLTFLELTKESPTNAANLAGLVQDQLQAHHISVYKLIAQSHNSTGLINNRTIHAHLQDTYPNAHFVHSYAHDLDAIVQRACASRIEPIKLFCVNLSRFAEFFSSARLCALLQAERSKNRGHDSWSFQSRITSSVYENQVEIAACLEKIQGEPSWDDGVVREAVRLEGLLNDAEFFFFLDFFYCVLQHVDALLAPQEANRAQTFEEFEVEMATVWDNIEMADGSDGEDEDKGQPLEKRLKIERRKVAASDACNLIVKLVRQMFAGRQYTAAFAVVDPRLFKKFRQFFPNDLVQLLVAKNPMLSRSKLVNELVVLYNNEKFAAATSVYNLLKLLKNSQLLSTFTQVSKLLEIVLTTPVATDDSKRCFDTLKKTRSFLGNAKRSEHLNALAVLAVHRDVIESISGFNNIVIDRFATEKNITEYLFQ